MATQLDGGHSMDKRQKLLSLLKDINYYYNNASMYDDIKSILDEDTPDDLYNYALKLKHYCDGYEGTYCIGCIFYRDYDCDLTSRDWDSFAPSLWTIKEKKRGIIYGL